MATTPAVEPLAQLIRVHVGEETDPAKVIRLTDQAIAEWNARRKARASHKQAHASYLSTLRDPS